MSIISILISLLVFSILILVHELGHFYTARWFKVKINEFAIGMGPTLWKHKSKKNDNTVYSIRAIPMGGFVQMEGEDVFEDEPKNEYPKHVPDTNSRKFNEIPRWQRLIILASGAIMNIILGYILLTIVLMMSGNITTPKIESILDNMPMSQAGVMAGDQIISINHHRVNSGSDASYYISTALNESATRPIEFKLKRSNEIITKSVTPIYNEEEERYIFGIVYNTVPANLGNSLIYSFFDSILVVKAVCDVLGKVITLQFKNIKLAGPIGIVKEISRATQNQSFMLNVISLLYLAAQITINLGAINLVPVPALDGGRIFFILLEMIRRKSISPKKEAYIHMIGFILLLILIASVSVVDVIRLRT